MATRWTRWRRKVMSGVHFSLEQWRFLFPECLGPFFPLRISLCLFHNLLFFTTVLTILLSISLRTLSHKERGNRVNTLRYLGAILFSPFLLRSRVHKFCQFMERENYFFKLYRVLEWGNISEISSSHHHLNDGHHMGWKLISKHIH